MKKRILSLVVAMLMVISMVSAFPFSVSAAAATMSFVIKPIVYIGGGDEYNIVWKNNTAGIGYVTYSYNGQKYTVYDTDDGIVNSDDNYHSVRVPMSHLDSAGSYTATAAIVTARNGYNITLGASASVSSPFEGYNGGGTIKIAFGSDLHNYGYDNKRQTAQRVKYAIDNYMGKVNLIVLNGDLINYQHTEADFDCILKSAYDIAEGIKPVLYTRGNHECWGEYAQHITERLAFNTGEMYCTFNFGPISCVVVDCGEDKSEDSTQYADTRDHFHYMEEQLEWLKVQSYTAGSQYHLALGHADGGSAYAHIPEFRSAINKMGTDLQVVGHSHDSKFYPNSGTFPVLHDGGHDNYETMRTSLVTISNGRYDITAYDDSGSVLFTETVNATHSKGGSASLQTEASEESLNVSRPVVDGAKLILGDSKTAIPTKAGVSTLALKGAASSVSFTSRPVIFDGGMYYNIVWQSNSGARDAGYVEIQHEATSLRYKDSVGCVIRADSKIDTHSVRIPKESLEDCVSYEVKMRLVTNWEYWGTWYDNQAKTTYGPYVGTSKTTFRTPASGDSVNILAITNSKTTGDVEAIKKSYSGTPDMVVTLGNMVNSLNTESDFGNYIKYMYQLTGGNIPVVFLRGENETHGEFAANLNRFLRPISESGAMNVFYFNSMAGEVSIIALDTGAEKADGDASYNGYAAFDKIRKDELKWLSNGIDSSFENTYNIVFAHADNLENNLGVNFASKFADLKTDLVVTGEKGTTSFVKGSTYSTATCGSIAGDTSPGLYITCKNNKITVTKLGSKDVIGTVEVTPPENKPNTKPGNGQTTNNPGNNSQNTNGDGYNSGGSERNGHYEGGSTRTDKQYVAGDYDGVDGSVYIRTVPEGWYNDYLAQGITLTDITAVHSDGVITEGAFITLVAKLASVDLSAYPAETVEAKAIAWAQDYQVYAGYLSETSPITDDVISAILSNIFHA